MQDRVDGSYLLLSHSANDSDHKFLVGVEFFLNLFAEVAFGNFDIIFRSTIGGHEVEEAIVDVDLQAKV